MSRGEGEKRRERRVRRRGRVDGEEEKKRREEGREKEGISLVKDTEKINKSREPTLLFSFATTTNQSDHDHTIYLPLKGEGKTAPHRE